MDSGKLIDMITGLITALIIGAVGYLFSTAGEHDKRIEHQETMTDYHDEQLKNFWMKRDDDIEKREEMTKMIYDFQVDYWKRETEKAEK